MASDYQSTSKKKQAEANKIMTSKQLKDCHTVIHTASVASGAAAYIPIPTADAIPISAAQVAMVMGLGTIFNQKLSEASVKGMIGATASAFLGRNIVKVIPIIGWGISSIVAAGITEAIGWTIAVDFAKQQKTWSEESNNSAEKRNDEEKIKNETESEMSEIKEIKDSLKERVQPFLIGEKSPLVDIDEFKQLEFDFERVLDYIDDSDPLRDLYDKFLLLGV